MFYRCGQLQEKDGPHFVYPYPSFWTCAWFLFFDYSESRPCEHVHRSLSVNTDLLSPGEVLGSGTAGLQDKFMLNFCRKLPGFFFQSGCTISDAHQPRRRVLGSPQPCQHLLFCLYYTHSTGTFIIFIVRKNRHLKYMKITSMSHDLPVK